MAIYFRNLVKRMIGQPGVLSAERRKYVVETILQIAMNQTFQIPSTKEYLYISLELIMNFDTADATTL